MHLRRWPPHRAAILAVVALLVVALGAIGAARDGPQRFGLPVLAQSGPDCSSLATPAPAAPATPGYVQITFWNLCGQAVPMFVDVAADMQTQEQGLMGVAQLPDDEGELFVFNNLAGGNEVQAGFWMEDTLIPLSIAFIGKDLTVHEVQDMAPETTNLHIPQAPYLYAVEANQGWFARHAVGPGSTVDLSAALATLAPGQ